MDMPSAEDRKQIHKIMTSGKAFIEACGEAELDGSGTDVANPGCLRHVGNRATAEDRASGTFEAGVLETEDAAFDVGMARRMVERALLTIGHCGEDLTDFDAWYEARQGAVTVG